MANTHLEICLEFYPIQFWLLIQRHHLNQKWEAKVSLLTTLRNRLNYCKKKKKLRGHLSGAVG